MIKRVFTLILTLSILNGFYITSFASQIEPMLKIWLYAPKFMLSSLEDVLSYGVAYTDSNGVQKLITITGNDETLGKYVNNREFHIPASQIENKNIDYAYVTVSIKTEVGKYENRTYYYKSDGTSSLFKEKFSWEQNQDKSILIYLDSLYVVTIKNDKDVNDYYIKPSTEKAINKPNDNYECERGERVFFDMENKNVTVICKDDHVYLPIRSMAELFEFDVRYLLEDNYTKVEIKNTNTNTHLVLKTGFDSYCKDGINHFFDDDMKPFISQKNIYVPVRILETLGIGVEYNSYDQMIYIKPRSYRTNFTKHDGGTYSISFPRDWVLELLPDTSIAFKKSNDKVGSFKIMDYDPTLPLSQFEGNDSKTLVTKQLDGFRYPTTKVIIRRTQPSACYDTCYVDELYIYLIPEKSKFAYTLCFDLSKVNEETAIEIAENITIKTYPMQIHNIAEKWAEAVKNEDGKAQYNLLSAERKLAIYEDYAACHWKNTISIPCVESYSVRARSNEATITYTYTDATGSVSKYYQTLIFIEENGSFYIDYFTQPKKQS